MAGPRNFLSPRQVARATGLSESSIKRWCDDGLIAVTRTAGGHRRIALEDVEAYLQSAGYRPIDAGVLGVPVPTGITERTLARAAAGFRDAVQTSPDAAGQIASDLHEAGQPWCAILDEVILPAASVCEVGAPEGSNGHRNRIRRRNILLVLAKALETLPLPSAEAPLALAGSLDGAPDSIAVLAAELTLAAAGWRADSLGTLLPFRTLQEAVERQAPRLLFLDVPVVESESGLLSAWNALRAAAELSDTRIALGGAGLSPQLAASMSPAIPCLNCRTLDQTAHALTSS